MYPYLVSVSPYLDSALMAWQLTLIAYWPR
jgi:hypothetical protein